MPRSCPAAGILLVKTTRTHSITLGDAPLEAATGEFDMLIDARSPSEYADDHVPGAVSLPVLDDEERVRVGTLYKQVSPFDARKLGAALVSRNIARHLETALARQPREWKPLVYCWRGGKRSGSFAQVLREIGWNACTLEGGYKAYRRHVVEQLEALPRTMRFRVVHGTTGSGKSRLLEALHSAGEQVLDLEQLAAHRGSVLGGLPERAQPTQKAFESSLRRELATFDPARTVYVEGESRKIGQLQVPAALIESMRAADCLLLEADIDVRVELLCAEYRHFFSDPGSLEAQLDCLLPLHGRAVIDEWKMLATQCDWASLVRRLLVEHYDPAYHRSSLRNFVKLTDAPLLRLPASDSASFRQIAILLAGGQPLPPATGRELDHPIGQGAE